MDNLLALKQQLLVELRETLRIKQLNLQLMDAMEMSIILLLSEAEKNGEKLPHIHRLQGILRRVRILYDELYPPTNLQHPDKTPDEDNTTKNIVEWK
jgi:hypothetical protein